MKLKLGKQLLAAVIALIMCFGMIPAGTLMVKAAGEPATITFQYTGQYADTANATFTSVNTLGGYTLNNDSSKSLTAVYDADYGNLVLLTSLADGYTLTGWKAKIGNGDWQTYSQNTAIETGDYIYYWMGAASNAGVDISSLHGLGGAYFYFQSASPVNIEPILSYAAPSFTISAVSSDSSAGNVAPPQSIGTNAYSLTATPNSDFMLDYWESAEGTNATGGFTKVSNSDGKATLQVTIAKNMTYRAVFGPADVILGGTLRCAPIDNPSSCSSLTGQTITAKPIYAGQRVALQLDYRYGGPLSTNTSYSYNLYAGGSVSGTPLKTVSGVYTYVNDTQGRNLTFCLNDLPSLSQVTVSAKIGDNAAVVKTYDLTVLTPEETVDLDYFSSPNVYANWFNRVYDTLSFTDSKTGKLTMYAASGGGLLKLNDSGTGFDYVSGLSLTTSDNEYPNGKIIALGGTADRIIAFTYTYTPTGGGDGTNAYCIYEYTSSDGWTVADNSSVPETFDGQIFNSQSKQIGAVFSADNVWSDKAHWNGSAWTKSGYQFTSMKRVGNSTAYAGSASGLYKYSGGSWAAFSSLSGASDVLSVTQDGGLIAKNGGHYYRVSASGTATAIDTSALPSDVRNILVSGDSVYALVSGKKYYDVGTSGYTGSYIYKQTADGWAYCNVPAFNDEADLANPDDFNAKSRMDGVQDVFEISPGVTLLTGYNGAYYAMYGDTAVTFEPNNGDSAITATGKIGTPITLPDTPKLNGYTFAGWYYTNTPGDKTTFDPGAFPAKNLTVYARWTENAATVDPLADAKATASTSLDSSKGQLNQRDYTDAEWARVEAAWNAAKTAIKNASTYDNMQKALVDGVKAMGEVHASYKGTVQAAVSIEKFVLGQGYVMEPVLIRVRQNTPVSKVITDLLTEKFGASPQPWEMTGSITNAFYLSAIKDSDTDISQMPQYIKDALLTKFGSIGSRQPGWLGEFDYTSDSGWMYSVNNSFPGMGAAAKTVQDGDVVRWQYTLLGYGADLNADNSAWGAVPLKSLADKDALMWRVAEINTNENKTDYGTAYADAVAALTKLDSAQSEVDAALAALNAVQQGDDRPEPTDPGDDTNPGDAPGNNTPPVSTDYKTALTNVLAYLKNTVKSPGLGSVGGEWAVLALARGNANVPAGYYEDYLARIIQVLKENDGVLPNSTSKKTEYSRLILALTSLGVDITNVGGCNLLTPLGNFDDVIKQGVNGPIFSLIALDTKHYAIPAISDSSKQVTRQRLIDYILRKEILGGGFALTGTIPDPDITAMALQALAPYRSQPLVAAVIDRAVTVLSNIQRSDGGYASWGTVNVESSAQVITALTALGINPAADPRFVKANGDPVTALLVYQQTNGGFIHTFGGDGNDEMSTEQAAYALVAFDRFVKHQNRLYDMTDVTKNTQPGDTAPKSGVTLTDPRTGVTVSAGAGVIPSGAELDVESVVSAADYSAARHALQDADKFALFDISLTKNNVEIEPNGKVTISLPIPKGFDASKCKVYRINADGTKTDLHAALKDGYLVFGTDHFNLYAVAQMPVDSGTTPNPRTGENGISYAVLALTAAALGALMLRCSLPAKSGTMQPDDHIGTEEATGAGGMNRPFPVRINRARIGGVRTRCRYSADIYR